MHDDIGNVKYNYDQQGRLIKVLYSYDNPGSRTILFKDFIRYKEKVLYHQKYNDTIYYLSTKGMQPWLYIDFKDRRITKDIISKITDQRDRLRRPVGPPANILTGNSFYTETEDHIYFAFDADHKGNRAFNYLFYSKKSGSSVIFPPGLGSDEILFEKYRLLYRVFLQDVNSNGQFIGQMDPILASESIESINDLIIEGFVTVNGNESINELTKYNENSNPVLVLYTFRDSF